MLETIWKPPTPNRASSSRVLQYNANFASINCNLAPGDVKQATKHWTQLRIRSWAPYGIGHHDCGDLLAGFLLGQTDPTLIDKQRHEHLIASIRCHVRLP